MQITKKIKSTLQLFAMAFVLCLAIASFFTNCDNGNVHESGGDITGPGSNQVRDIVFGGHDGWNQRVYIITNERQGYPYSSIMYGYILDNNFTGVSFQSLNEDFVLSIDGEVKTIRGHGSGPIGGRLYFSLSLESVDRGGILYTPGTEYTVRVEYTANPDRPLFYIVNIDYSNIEVIQSFVIERKLVFSQDLFQP